MEESKNYKMYSLESMLDEEFGKKGTPEREAFELRVERKVADMDKASYHITLPVSLHKLITEKANELGTNISAYITSVMNRELLVGV
ncbi:MAG: hypothetical protein KBT34_08795 [Prevotella sp.]|nr:hypothetical protein [Candidatus Prevotella equi]